MSIDIVEEQEDDDKKKKTTVEGGERSVQGDGQQSRIISQCASPSAHELYEAARCWVSFAIHNSPRRENDQRSTFRASKAKYTFNHNLIFKR